MDNPNIPGLGIILGRLIRFENLDQSVPHIGWDSTRVTENGVLEHECFMSYKIAAITARYTRTLFAGATRRSW